MTSENVNVTSKVNVKNSGGTVIDPATEGGNLAIIAGKDFSTHAAQTDGTQKAQMFDGTNTIGTATHPVRTDPTGTTTQPVSGTVTTSPPANASTNLTQVGGVALTEGQKAMAASIPVVLASDQSAIPASQSGTWAVRNQDGSGTALTSNAGALDVGFKPVFSAQGTVAANPGPGNGFNGTLTAGQQYVGPFEDVSRYAAINIFVTATQSSAASGAFVEWSDDGVTVRGNPTKQTITGTAVGGSALSFVIFRAARYFRTNYTQGGTSGTILVETSYMETAPAVAQIPLAGAIDSTSNATITRSVLSAQTTGTQSFANVKATAQGDLRVGQQAVISTVNSTSTAITGTSRSVTDLVTTAGSTTATSATAVFTGGDTGSVIIGNNIGVLPGTIITFVNSTTVTLGVAATKTATGQTATISPCFNGAFEDVSNFAGVGIMVTADSLPANNGCIAIWSTDGTHVDRAIGVDVSTFGNYATFPIESQYFKLIVTTGSVAQTFLRVQSKYTYFPNDDKATPIVDRLSTGSTAEVTKAVSMVADTQGNYIAAGQFSRIANRQYLDTEESRLGDASQSLTAGFPSSTASTRGYIGIALIGSAATASVWSVLRYEFDANGSPFRARFTSSLRWDWREFITNGTATSGTTAKLVDTTKNFTTLGVTTAHFLLITAGSNNSVTPIAITSITTTTNPNDTLNFAVQSTAIDNTSVYQVQVWS